ncbi:MAG TPA: hypothetical protein VLG09_01525 [Candidatus Saccharimonadales bacterium]|nr:hypothetical protein [Candidatus Saccharimonadales bacterium]
MKSSSVTDAKAQEKIDDGLVQWVQDAYNRCRNQRAQYQKEWEYNLLMYSGEQFANLIAATGQIKKPNMPSSASKLVTNLLRPMVRQQIARMTSEKPTVTVVPVSASDDDLMAAQGGQAVFDSLYTNQKIQSKLIRTAFWTVITGNGFFKTYWDQNKVDNNFLTVNPLISQPQPTAGDICFGAVTPFNLFVPDLLEEDIECQPYVLEVYTKPVLWANTVWKEYLKKPVEADCIGSSEIFESSYWKQKNDGSATPDSVKVMECYLKPGAHKDFPDGGMLTVVGNQLVQRVDHLPYSHGEFPHAHWGDIQTGKFYRDSILKDTSPINKQYNTTRNQMITSMIRTARTQFAYVEGSIDPNRMTSRPGEMFPVKPGFQFPQAIPAQPIPAFVENELRVLKGDLEDISAQHTVSKGQAPGSGVVAATAINFLLEQDNTVFYTTIASGEDLIQKVGKQALSIIADMWSLPKIIRTIGTDAAFDAVELKGSDIARGLDIRVERGSMLPESKTAKQALLMDMAKMGFISPENLLDLLPMGGVKRLTEIIKVDMSQAQRENLKMKKLDPVQLALSEQAYQQKMLPDAMGNVDPSTFDPTTGQTLTQPLPVPVNDFDNHKVHIEVHNRFRKTQEFELLDDKVKKVFANHILQHQVFMMMSAQRDMMSQSGMPIPGMDGPGMSNPFTEQQQQMDMGGGDPNANQQPGQLPGGSGQAP